MKVTLAYAERQLRHWSKKVEELRLTSNASNTSEVEKETEEEKRDIPPTPPIERKEEDKEKECVCLTRAREGETLTEARERVTEEGFPIFWKAYPGPRRTKKGDCKRRFHARMVESKDPDALLATMLRALDRWKLTRLWIKEGGSFIMHPATWLNNESWLDENIPPAMADDGIDKATIAERAEQARQIETACVEARQIARKETLARIKGPTNVLRYSQEELNKIKEEFDS